MRTPHLPALVLCLLVMVLLVGVPLAYSQELNSPSYKIKGDAQTSGTLSGDSTTYGLEGEVNPFANTANSSTYKSRFGYNPRIQARTPYAPTLANPSTYYNKLELTIDASGNPTDTLFAIAISSDDFTTSLYVQNDNSVSGTLGMEDYQTYAAWGSGSGFEVLGLNHHTEYKARVKALHGDFTETGWGPESAEISTGDLFITMTISPSTTVAFGTLNLNQVSSAGPVTLTVSTNNETGYQTNIRDNGDGINPGLYDGVGNLITTSDTTLIAGTVGYGAQGGSGTASIDSKYNVVGNTVGALQRTAHRLSYNSGPVTDEAITVTFKASISASTTGGAYTDTIYYTVATQL